MNLTVTENLNDSHLRELQEIYEYSFPRSEKKPFDLILEKQKEQKAQIFGILSRDRLCGLLITIPGEDFTLIDYFAIARDLRGNGIGSQALQAFFDRFPETVFLLEIEDPDGKDPQSTEQRRLSFYESLGMRRLDWKACLFGVDMAMLSLRGSCSFEAYQQLLMDALDPAVKEYITEIRV